MSSVSESTPSARAAKKNPVRRARKDIVSQVAKANEDRGKIKDVIKVFRKAMKTIDKYEERLDKTFANINALAEAENVKKQERRASRSKKNVSCTFTEQKRILTAGMRQFMQKPIDDLTATTSQREIHKRFNDYLKENELHDPNNKTKFTVDDTLKLIFPKNVDKSTMGNFHKTVWQHLEKKSKDVPVA